MRYFYDTEFIEDGRTIELISIGIVGEDGSEYYAVSTDFNPAAAGPWVRDNVLGKLPSPNSSVWKNTDTIREEVFEFLIAGKGPVDLWAWVGAYDHLVLAQLFGDMTKMPRELPRFTNELKQYWLMAGKPALPRTPDSNHDALIDARFNLEKFRIINEALPLGRQNKVLRG